MVAGVDETDSIEMSAEPDGGLSDDDDRLFMRGLLYAVGLGTLIWSLVVLVLLT
jgi:hypothetical protein